MFFEIIGKDQSEQKATKQNKALLDLLIYIDSLDRDVKNLMTELKVSAEQIDLFVNHEQNFTAENWQELQTQRKLLDEKLTREKENIPNPVVNQQRQLENQLKSNWLFVK